jgi:mono/diheme cytochrome c family protein
MKGYYTFWMITFLGATVLASCTKDKNSPGYEFMPDMYYSPAYKPGEANPNFADGKTYQDPVNGSIAYSDDPEQRINFLPYPFQDTPEGREQAYNTLKNPLVYSEIHLNEGARLYGTFCAPCHGLQGKGDGSVVKVLEKKDNYGLKPPAYDSDELRNISEGRIFHAMQYGKGNMGSYASQLNAKERWQITFYVQTLQRGSSETLSADAATEN